MRTYEFERKSKTAIQLGEIPTPICYKKIGSHFTPAVLCLQMEGGNPSETVPGMAEVIISAVPELLYWGGEKEPVLREKISFSTQEALGLPLTMLVPMEENETDLEQQKRYYLTAEKVCCALEAGCLTDSMKEQYLQDVQPIPAKELLHLYRYFFPEASEKLF